MSCSTSSIIMLTHHAYIIEGGRTAFEAVRSFLETYAGITSAHPDIALHDLGSEKLKVEDSARIQHSIQKKPVVGTHTYTIIYACAITEQAQNALLKICEEPPLSSKIFLITEHIPAILPTLLSRFVTPSGAFKQHIDSVQRQHEVERENKKHRTGTSEGDSLQVKVEKTKHAPKKNVLDIDLFLASDIDTRFSIVKNIHTALDKEYIGIQEVWQFIHQIERYVRHTHAQVLSGTSVAVSTGKKKTAITATPRIRQSAFETVMQETAALMNVQQYAHMQGNSIKMLLEYMAIHIRPTL